MILGVPRAQVKRRYVWEGGRGKSNVGLLVLDSTRKGRGEGETETLELQRHLTGIEAAASEKAWTALSRAGCSAVIPQAPAGAAALGVLRRGGPGSAPRMSPGCSLEGATTKEHTQGSAHVSGSCRDKGHSP